MGYSHSKKHKLEAICCRFFRLPLILHSKNTFRTIQPDVLQHPSILAPGKNYAITQKLLKNLTSYLHLNSTATTNESILMFDFK